MSQGLSRGQMPFYQVNGIIPVAVALPFHHPPRPSRAGGDAEPAAIAFGEIDLGSRIR